MNSSDLFETPPYLEQKLGPDFFEDIPQKPGIYRFYDDNGILLYVGKAKNLRRRLFTYKRAKPGKTSRKEAAMISKIHRFEYDVLNSEEEAILQENYWIRQCRPEFNHANKHTETYYFITIQENKGGLMFGLTMNPSGNLFPVQEKPFYSELHLPCSEAANAKTYGCFKGHRLVRTSLGALLQLLWMAEHQTVSPLFLPVQLSRNLTPMRFQVPVSNRTSFNSKKLIEILDNWFLGNSPDLVYVFKESIKGPGKSRFAKKFIDENLEILTTFFQRNLEPYRIMRESKPDRKSHLIHQHELDDWFAILNSK